MKPRPIYSQQEKDIILKEIRQYPTNLSHAFSEAAMKLPNRTTSGIAFYWYTSLKKKSGVVITCGSRSGLSTNRKNTIRNDSRTMPNQKLSSFMIIVSHIVSLNKDDIRLLQKLLRKGLE